MARFSDLSLDLLELIASHLRVNRPGNGAGSTREILLTHEGGISEVARDLREAQASFSSFSCVGKIAIDYTTRRPGESSASMVQMRPTVTG
ncbi:hypothetical protein K456DRAFT_54470 [Colletotrichum gloeosporioides 23]|nr:hypothetical protein K456DRAFT_54470 [Colletotrichum gloeosporioides 23]